jgi:hypothetical protein
MIKKMKLVLLCLAVTSITALVPAQTTHAKIELTPCYAAERHFLSFPTWDYGLQCEHDPNIEGSKHVNLVASGGVEVFIWTVVLNVFNMLLRIAGILAVCLIIVNAYQYLASAGAPDKIAKAKVGLIQALIGLAIAMLASTIIYFIIDRVV